MQKHLDPSWQDRFGGLCIEQQEVGTTLFSGTLPDQAALHGVLLQIIRLGLTLLSLETSEASQKDQKKGSLIMTENNDSRTSRQSTATVQSGMIGHRIQPGPAYQLLDIFIGKWINEGHTIASADAPSVNILTSDVYEWMPGGFFVLHTAYGRIGDLDVGGTEILSYDAASKQYRSHFFDSQGHISTQELTASGDTWKWTGEQTRCTAVFTGQGKTQTAHHERLDEQGNWVPSMDVTLTKVE